MNQKLLITDHNRDIAGLKYVYPVLSRRAGGLSIGINFNTNNACNWRCVYCQVPGLVRGSAPKMDFYLLEKELRFFLEKVINGDFFDQFNVPESQRVIKDIAISGNGEPTSLSGFGQAIKLIGDIATELNILPRCQFVLITNGSLMHSENVQQGLKVLNDFNGRVWFKLDSVTEFGRKAINDSKQSNRTTFKNLKICSELCETVLQTCVVRFLASEEAEAERKAYLEFVHQLKETQSGIMNIMLYSLARPSLQPESVQLEQVEQALMDGFSKQLRALGYNVTVNL